MKWRIEETVNSNLREPFQIEFEASNGKWAPIPFGTFATLQAAKEYLDSMYSPPKAIIYHEYP